MNADDEELSQQLTAAIRATDGVAGVYAAKPLVEAAVETVAVKLSLAPPDALVEIDRAEGFTTVTAHIATAALLPAPDVLRAVGELIRNHLASESSAGEGLAVNVKVRLVEDSGTHEI